MKPQKSARLGIDFMGSIFAILAIFCLIYSACKQPTDPGTPPSTYTVTFMDANAILSAVKVESGRTVNRPSNPSKTGYMFDNWYANSGLTTSFDFNTPIMGNTSLYAKFIINRYTVTFMDGSTVLSTLSDVAHGSTVDRPSANPTKTNYTFDNWYSNSGLTTLFNFSTPITNNTTVYAKWAPPGNIAVTFSGISANGSATQTTTQLTLTFSQAITGLSAADISLSGVSGVQKGTLSGSGMTYTLPINGFSSGSTLTVAVEKEGYTISGSPKTVIIYYAIPVTFNSATANGSSSQTTTELTLTFSQAISGLSANDIILSGVSGVQKGTLSGSGPAYTLPISGFSSGGNLGVAVEKEGYTISGSPKTLTIYHAIPVTFDNVSANGSSSQTTTQLTLTFTQAITGLSANDITLSGISNVQKGTLSGSGPTYILPISDFTDGGTLNVAVEKEGYTISESPKTVTIYYIIPFTITIDFAQIIDQAPKLDNIIIYRSKEPRTATINLGTPEQYTGFAWYYNNILLSNSSSITLDSSDIRYNMVGIQLLTLEVVKSGILYSTSISFTVEE